MKTENAAENLQPKYVYPLAVWAILIFISSSIPGTSLPPLDMWSADKLIHSGVFGILAFFSCRAFAHYGNVRSKEKTWVISLSIIFCLVYAALDETHQMFVPNRDASALDLLADALGIAAVHMYWFFRRH